MHGDQPSATKRSVLITGAGGGLGAATTRRFVQRGWHVFAADLTPPPVAEGVTPIEMDVTDTDSVTDAINSIAPRIPRGLHCLVTFAGILAVGPLVELPDNRLQQIIDVNVVGTHRAVRCSYPLLQRGQGRVILISSETGWQRAMPFNGPYALTKHAIEAYGDALRRELSHVGIPVTIIQPGPFRTNMTGSIGEQIAAATPEGSAFAPMVNRVGRLAAKEHLRAHDPAILAATVVDAATSSRPRIRRSVRPNLARVLVDKLPVAVVDALLRRLL